MPSAGPNGNFEETRSFFRASKRTLRRWIQKGLISYFRCGKNLMFSQDGIAEFYAQHYLDASGGTLEERRAAGRQAWSAHLEHLRADNPASSIAVRLEVELETLKHRVAALEAAANHQPISA